ncbi:MAG: ribose 5-phosphate isomerase B [Saprospiraceae bacterium]|jgi:ribose 5-phosphate isomerase B|nr:ribose 5-phosphate isomerase B [Saprospiraceae bacterium]
MSFKTIAIGCDHAGFTYKDAIIAMLVKQGMAVLDFGTFSEESVDYPDFAHPAADSVEQGRADLGIVLCGSGNGVAITVNKHKGIRAGLCWTEELAALVRQHNNANMLAIPARFVSLETAQAMVNTFLHTDFEGGRHDRRVAKIACN